MTVIVAYPEPLDHCAAAPGEPIKARDELPTVVAQEAAERSAVGIPGGRHVERDHRVAQLLEADLVDLISHPNVEHTPMLALPRRPVSQASRWKRGPSGTAGVRRAGGEDRRR